MPRRAGITMSIVRSRGTRVRQGLGSGHAGALPAPLQAPVLGGPQPRAWLRVAPHENPFPGTVCLSPGWSASPAAFICHPGARPPEPCHPLGAQRGLRGQSPVPVAGAAVAGTRAGGTSGKALPPPLCGPLGPVVPALGPGTWSGPLGLGWGAAWGPGRGFPGSRFHGDCGAWCPSGLGAGLAVHPVCARRGCPCRDCLASCALWPRRLVWDPSPLWLSSHGSFPVWGSWGGEPWGDGKPTRWRGKHTGAGRTEAVSCSKGDGHCANSPAGPHLGQRGGKRAAECTVHSVLAQPHQPARKGSWEQASCWAGPGGGPACTHPSPHAREAPVPSPAGPSTGSSCEDSC